MNTLFQDEQNNQDDSEVDDEIEPRLKYVRMRNDLVNILQKDAASCIAVHPKVHSVNSMYLQNGYQLLSCDNDDLYLTC